MGTRRILLPILLVSICAPRLPAASTSPSKQTLTIVFTGACDFIYDSKTHMTRVVLPPPVEGYGMAKIPRHQWFIRHEGLAYLVGTPGPISIRVGKEALPAGEINVVGFTDLVHKMSGTPSEDVVKKSLSLQLPAGQLRAVMAKDRGAMKFSFARTDADQVPPEKGKSLASEAILTIPIQTKEDHVSMLVGDTEIRLAITGNQAKVKIGNLPVDDIFYTGAYQANCQDLHFLLHYTLLGGPDNMDASPVPYLIDKGCPLTASFAPSSKSQAASEKASQVPAKQAHSMTGIQGDGKASGYGNRENCYPAWWVI